MKNKDLEKLFMEYMNKISLLGNMAYMQDKEESWILFGEEDFHFNRKGNTIYMKPFNHVMENVYPPEVLEHIVIDWVAYQKNLETGEEWLITGPDNPYENKKLSTVKNGVKIIRAIPARLAQKMQKDFD